MIYLVRLPRACVLALLVTAFGIVGVITLCLTTFYCALTEPNTRAALGRVEEDVQS